jgi:hypothetical protein
MPSGKRKVDRKDDNQFIAILIWKKSSSYHKPVEEVSLAGATRVGGTPLWPLATILRTKKNATAFQMAQRCVNPLA